MIQSLFYPDDLDRRLRKLRTDARTAVEETGSNLLHLAFGFLEWHDPKAGQHSHLASLILVPAEMERRLQRGGRHSYSLTWTGEDLQANISLEKKLAEEFGLTLPALAEDQGLAQSALVQRLLLGDSCAGDLSALVTLVGERARLLALRKQLAEARPLAKTLVAFLGQESGGETGELQVAAVALRLAIIAPKQASALSPAALEASDADLCRDLSRQISLLREQTARLERYFAPDLARLGDSARLRVLSRTLQDAGIFSKFGGRYRAARREALALSPSGLPLTKQPRRLLDAAQFLDEQEALLETARRQGFVCHDLKALVQAIEAAVVLRAWHAQIEAAFGRGLSQQAAWGQVLRGLEAAQLSDLAAAGEDPGGVALLALEGPLGDLPQTVEPWVGLLGAWLPAKQAESVARISEADFETLLDRLEALTALLAAAEEAAKVFAAHCDLDWSVWQHPEVTPLQRLDLALAEEERLAEWLEVDRLLSLPQPPGVAAVMQAVLHGRLPWRPPTTTTCCSKAWPAPPVPRIQSCRICARAIKIACGRPSATATRP